MRVIGLTGGIATGKSTVSSTIQEEGVAVVDCDKIAHAVVKKGKWAHRRVVRAFGDVVLRQDGELDRPALGKIIFSDASARKKLNTATHLPVFVEMFRQLAVYWLRGRQLVFVDMPLLFETGSNKWFGDNVLVACSETNQIERLMKRDGCSKEDAQAKIASQMPLATKRERSTYTIENNGSKEDAANETREMVSSMQKKSTLPGLLWSPLSMAAGLIGLGALVLALCRR